MRNIWGGGPGGCNLKLKSPLTPRSLPFHPHWGLKDFAPLLTCVYVRPWRGRGKEGGGKGKVISSFIPSGIYQLHSPPPNCASLLRSFCVLFPDLVHSASVVWRMSTDWGQQTWVSLQIYHLPNCPINTRSMNKWGKWLHLPEP